MSVQSASSGVIEESSSDAEYSSLDTCNSLSAAKGASYSESDKFDDKFKTQSLKLSQSKFNLDATTADSSLPAISSITLQRIIQFELYSTVYVQSDNKEVQSMVDLIMNYFHPMQYIKIYFVTLNGLTDSTMKCTQLVMYKNDSIANLQKNIATKFKVNADQLILCEFWKSILTKLKYETISLIASTDNIIAYYMPSYLEIRRLLFKDYDNEQLSYTSLVHQCHNYIDDDETSLSSLNFQLSSHPYFDYKVPNTPNNVAALSLNTPPPVKRNTSYSTTEFTEYTQQSAVSDLSRLSTFGANAQYFDIPPPIDENDSFSEPEHDDIKLPEASPVPNPMPSFKHFDDGDVDVINVGVPIPLMLPKNTIVSTKLIRKQVEMILAPYLKTWNNRQLKPYELYVLGRSTVYCGLCQNNAFCKGCKLSRYTEIHSNDLDFIISIRWDDEDSFHSFDQTVFSLSK